MSDYDGPTLTLREATDEDCRFVWETNNHPTVRENAINTDRIPWDDHREWYKRTLQSDARLLWIGQVDDEPCGVVRMDLDRETGGTEITVAVQPEYRGRGIGRRLIRHSSERALDEPGIEYVDALIRPDNDASIRAFRAAGYRPVDERERQGVILRAFRYE